MDADRHSSIDKSMDLFNSDNKGDDLLSKGLQILPS